MKKFDVVFGNPPYSLGKKNFEQVETDLAMLEVAFAQAQHLSFVMTGRLLYKKELQKYRQKYSQYCQYIEIFDGKKIFDVRLTFPFIIINLNKHRKSNQIHIVDKRTNEDYYIENLGHFNKYGFNQQQYQWWQKFNNTPMIDSYQSHCVSWFNFTAPLGFCLNSASSVRMEIYDSVVEQCYVFKDKEEVSKRTKNITPQIGRRWHMIPIDNEEDQNIFVESYHCQIIRAIVDVTKQSWRVMTKTTSMLPWPSDQNGKLKVFSNDDWIKKLNMPQSVADKILRYYKIHTQLKIQEKKWGKRKKKM